jgi:hypothetical protein
MSRALLDIVFAGIASAPVLGAVGAYAVCRHAERRARPKPICGLEYEFTTAPLWEASADTNNRIIKGN